MDSLIKKANKQMLKKRKCESKLKNDSKKRKIDYNDNSAKSSWPQFRFFVIDEEWQRLYCSQFGLQFVSCCKTSGGDCNTVLTRPDLRSVKVMLGDGNCLFRSLSYVLTGSQEQYSHVRSLICGHMYSILHLLLAHIITFILTIA